jgi:tetratricopeptide (TPR) repeat protein
MGQGGPEDTGRRPAGRAAAWSAIWLAGLGALYALGLRPSIGWNDAPEFADVAYTLGVAHPPGSPTYALLGKLATLVPLGGIAARVNLLSALCALGALALLAASVRRVHARTGGDGRAGGPPPGGGRPMPGGWAAGVLAATLLGIGPTFWSYATQAEVYAPFALTTALLLYLGVRWDETLDERLLLAGAFLFGLSGGIHGTAIFFAPALLILVLMRMPKGRRAGTLARAAIFGLLGASVYLYLPVRAATEPAFNWGDPDGWSRFWAHVSDRKDDAKHAETAALPWWPYVRILARNLNAELTPAGWLPAAAGLAFLAVRAPRTAIFTLGLALGNALFFLRLWTIPDAYLPTFVLVAFWAGIALARAGTWPGRAGRAAAAAAWVAVLGAVALQASSGSARAHARANAAPRSAAEANLLPLPPGAIAVVTANWFPMRFLQDVEGMRPDVTILLASDLSKPDHFTPVTRERFPRITVPEGPVAGARWDLRFRDLIAANVGRAPIYWEPLSVLSRNVRPYLRPWRYLWRFEADANAPLTRAESEAYFADLRALLAREFATPGVLEDPDAVRYHTYLLNVCAEALKLRGRPQDALVLLELALRVSPDNPLAANDLGRLYSEMGRPDDARRMFERAAALTPGDATAILNVAILEMSLGRLDEARRVIASAIALNPSAAEAYYQLSVLERRSNRPEAARAALDLALRRTDDARFVRAWRAERATLASRRTP